MYPYTQTVEAVEQINPEGYLYRIRCGDMDIVKVAKLQIDLLRLFNALSAVIRRTFICSATRAPWPPPPTRRYRGKVTFSPILPIFQTFFSPNLIWLVSLVNLPVFLLTLPVNLLLLPVLFKCCRFQMLPVLRCSFTEFNETCYYIIIVCVSSL